MRAYVGLGSNLGEREATLWKALEGLGATEGIEVLAVTIFASNQASIRLFERHGFERWGWMPRVARLGDIERDLVMMGRRLAV